jgi:hypothetical protein
MNFVKFVALPILGTAVILFNFAIGSWTIGAIGGICLLYYLAVARRGRNQESVVRSKDWLQQVSQGLTQPSRLGLALLAAGAVILVAVFAFGLTVGVGVSIGIWLALFGLWIIAIRKRSRAGRE